MFIYHSSRVLPYVYMCIHKTTGQFYIGYREANTEPSTVDFPKYKTSSKKVRPRFSEFDWTIIAEFFSAESAYDYEQELINSCWDDVLLLNENVRANSKHRFRCTHEDRVYGPLTDEHKQKVSAGMKGKVSRSPETRAKMSESKKGLLLPTIRGTGNGMHQPGILEKHRAACILRSAKKKECPHCGGQFSSNTYARYHGNKCNLNLE